jgi:nicotinamidase-related amidase
MSVPRTLLQIAGADPRAVPLAESAVVIIDAQQEYVCGRLALAGIDTALQGIARLLLAARTAGAPVIHVVHRGRPGGLFDPLGKTFQIHPSAAPGPGEKIVEKELPNAFAKTALHLALLATERKSLVLAGFMTHMCVSATARAALDHGWCAAVIADATATRDLPDPLGGAPIPAADVQRASLAALADRFAVVARVQDLAA